MLGAIAAGSVILALLATALAGGVLMLVGGVCETVGAVWAWSRGEFFLHLVSGILGYFVVVSFLRTPVGRCSH